MFGEVMTTALTAMLYILDLSTLSASAVIYTARVLPTSPVNDPITKLPENGIPGYTDGKLPQLRYGIGSYNYYDDKKRMHLVTYINDHKGFKIMNDYIPFHKMDFAEEVRKNTGINDTFDNDASLIKYDDEDDDFEDGQQISLLPTATERNTFNDRSHHQMAAPADQNISPMEAFKTHFQNLFTSKDPFPMHSILFDFHSPAKNDKVNESSNNANTDTKISLNYNLFPSFPWHFPVIQRFNTFGLQQESPASKEDSSVSSTDKKVPSNSNKILSTDQQELPFSHWHSPSIYSLPSLFQTPHLSFLQKNPTGDTNHPVANGKFTTEDNDLLSVESKPLSNEQFTTGTVSSFSPLLTTKAFSAIALSNPVQRHVDEVRNDANPIVRHFAVHTVSYPYPLKLMKQE